MIGDPISHSLSPVIHNAAFGASGLDWVYVALPVPAGGGVAAVHAMKALGIAGMSVTMPHKEAVLAAVDEVSETAAALNAANCLSLLPDGRVGADNTDGAGFVDALRDDAGIEPAGHSFAVLGAGGAARAVILALSKSGASDIAVINRSHERGVAAARLAGEVGRVAVVGEVSQAEVVVNATPVGLGGDRSFPCDPSLLGSGQVVVDLIYNPATTAWMAGAVENGASAHNGLSMLIRQAAIAFSSWTQVAAPIGTMRNAAIAELHSR